MSRVNDLITDGVISSRSRRDYVVYCDLVQVKIGISKSHLLQAIIEPITIVNVACIKEGLRDTELRHSVSLGLVHLLMENSQFHRQIGLRLLYLFPKLGLFF